MALSRAFFTFLLYKPELLLNLLFLLSLRYLLACFFRCNGKFLVLLRFLRNLRTSRGPSLRLYRSKSELSLNLLFLRYLIACLPCCNEKYCLLLQFLPNLRLSRGSSLSSFFMIVHPFAKAVVSQFFRFQLPSFQNTADKILYDFYQFATVCYMYSFLPLFAIPSTHFCKQFPLNIFCLDCDKHLLANFLLKFCNSFMLNLLFSLYFLFRRHISVSSFLYTFFF